MTPSPDTGAGTPDYPEYNDALHGDSRPATDPAGLDVALAHVRQAIEWHRLGTRPTGISAELMHAERILARLSVADGPGPEERP